MNNYNSKIKLLDCTIRDGGIVNNFQFNDNFIINYLKTINQSWWLRGGSIPNKGFQSTIDKPDWVNRVAPPTNIIIKIIKQQIFNHLMIYKSLFFLKI